MSTKKTVKSNKKPAKSTKTVAKTTKKAAKCAAPNKPLVLITLVLFCTAVVIILVCLLAVAILCR